jgi:hypothetical protein
MTFAEPHWPWWGKIDLGRRQRGENCGAVMHGRRRRSPCDKWLSVHHRPRISITTWNGPRLIYAVSTYYKGPPPMITRPAARKLRLATERARDRPREPRPRCTCFSIVCFVFRNHLIRVLPFHCFYIPSFTKLHIPAVFLRVFVRL